MTNVRTQPSFIPEQELVPEPNQPRVAAGNLQSECCGCPACQCGCQYGLRSAKTGVSR